jgi:hypothetical protein
LIGIPRVAREVRRAVAGRVIDIRLVPLKLEKSLTERAELRMLAGDLALKAELLVA